MSLSDYEKIAKMLKTIAHPCRLRISEILKDGPIGVARIQARLNCKQSATSQHLNKMKNVGILRSQRKGNEVFYSIRNYEVLKIIKCLKNCPNPLRRKKCLKS
jgi:ArsR family transcriptional regulator